MFAMETKKLMDNKTKPIVQNHSANTKTDKCEIDILPSFEMDSRKSLTSRRYYLRSNCFDDPSCSKTLCRSSINIKEKESSNGSPQTHAPAHKIECQTLVNNTTNFLVGDHRNQNSATETGSQESIIDSSFIKPLELEETHWVANVKKFKPKFIQRAALKKQQSTTGPKQTFYENKNAKVAVTIASDFSIYEPHKLNDKQPSTSEGGTRPSSRLFPHIPLLFPATCSNSEESNPLIEPSVGIEETRSKAVQLHEVDTEIITNTVPVCDSDAHYKLCNLAGTDFTWPAFEEQDNLSWAWTTVHEPLNGSQLGETAAVNEFQGQTCNESGNYNDLAQTESTPPIRNSQSVDLSNCTDEFGSLPPKAISIHDNNEPNNQDSREVSILRGVEDTAWPSTCTSAQLIAGDILPTCQKAKTSIKEPRRMTNEIQAVDKRVLNANCGNVCVESITANQAQHEVPTMFSNLVMQIRHNEHTQVHDLPFSTKNMRQTRARSKIVSDLNINNCTADIVDLNLSRTLLDPIRNSETLQKPPQISIARCEQLLNTSTSVCEMKQTDNIDQKNCIFANADPLLREGHLNRLMDLSNHHKNMWDTCWLNVEQRAAGDNDARLPHSSLGMPSRLPSAKLQLIQQGKLKLETDLNSSTQNLSWLSSTVQRLEKPVGHTLLVPKTVETQLLASNAPTSNIDEQPKSTQIKPNMQRQNADYGDENIDEAFNVNAYCSVPSSSTTKSSSIQQTRIQVDQKLRCDQDFNQQNLVDRTKNKFSQRGNDMPGIYDMAVISRNTTNVSKVRVSCPGGTSSTFKKHELNYVSPPTKRGRGRPPKNTIEISKKLIKDQLKHNSETPCTNILKEPGYYKKHDNSEMYSVTSTPKECELPITVTPFPTEKFAAPETNLGDRNVTPDVNHMICDELNITSHSMFAQLGASTTPSVNNLTNRSLKNPDQKNNVPLFTNPTSNNIDASFHNQSKKASQIPVGKYKMVGIQKSTKENSPIRCAVEETTDQILRTVEYLRLVPESELIEASNINELINDQTFDW